MSHYDGLLILDDLSLKVITKSYIDNCLATIEKKDDKFDYYTTGGVFDRLSLDKEFTKSYKRSFLDRLLNLDLINRNTILVKTYIKIADIPESVIYNGKWIDLTSLNEKEKSSL